MSRAVDRVECLLLVSDQRYAEFCKPDGAVRLIEVQLPEWARGQGRIAWEQFHLPSLARAHGASVIYTPNNCGVIGSRIPSVIAIRNMEPLTPLRLPAPASTRLRHATLSRYTRVSARAAARVIAVSGAVRDQVLAMGVPADRIDVIYHGADDLPRPDLSRPPAGGFMAAAAKFVRYANLETMIRAFRILRDRGYAGHLRVAGGGHDALYEGEIRRLTTSLGLDETVQFLGYRPRAEVLLLMRDCDAFLFPSTLEACPFTLLEAMSQGAAIVATVCPPMPEFAADGAELVPATDTTGFAEAAWRLVQDTAAAAALRERAAARAAVFRWSETVERMVRTWERAADDRTPEPSLSRID